MKFKLVVEHDMTLHGVHTDTIAFSPTVVTVVIVSQVRKLQNQFLQNNIGDGTLPQAIHGGTRPPGVVELIIKILSHLFLLQLVSFTVDGDPL